MIDPSPAPPTILDQADRKVLAVAWIVGLMVLAFLLVVALVAGLCVRVFMWGAWG